MTEIKVISRPKLKNPVMLAGLPGIGNIGKVSVEYLIYKLGGKVFAELYSEYMPEWTVLENGVLRTLKINFSYARPKGSERDIIFITSDAQANAPLGQYVVTGEVLDFAKKMGVDTVGAMAAYVVPAKGQYARVVGAASDPETKKMLERSGVRLLDGGTIVGMNGLLPALAPMYGMKGFCLLGTTKGEIIDINASKAVLTVLSSMLNFELDVSELIQYSDLSKLTMQIPKQAAAPEEELGYIR
ncbi:MAG: PAC2 family protein [Candidatus Hadarchaeales archaeon]